MTRLFNKRMAWLGAIAVGLLFTGGCAGYGEGYYGEATLPASYYYGPDYYDPGYPYYYHIHDNDWWRHHDHDRGHFDGHDRFAGRHDDGRARIAGHREGPDGGHDGGEHGGHGAATAGGHIDGTRR